MKRWYEGNEFVIERGPDALGRSQYEVVRRGEVLLILTDDEAKDLVQGLIHVGWGGPL